MGEAGEGRSTHDRQLVRLAVAFCGFGLGEGALWLATIVYAFDRGGVREAGAVAVAGLVFAMVVAPFAAFFGDRFRSDRALATGFACQSAAAGLTAAAIWAQAPHVAYATAVLLSGSFTLTRPVVGSVIPAVTARPKELVRANVVIGVVDDIGRAGGPLIAALVFVWADVGTLFVIFGAIALGGVVLTWDLGLSHTANRELVGMDRHDLTAQVVGGLRALRNDRTLRAIVGAMVVGALAVGALDVFGVVFADLRLDASGGSVAGLLAAAVGMGSVVGSLVAGRLVGRHALVRPFVVSAAVLGVPIAALSTAHQLVPALIGFALVGAGRSLLAVTGAVALQRLAPRNLLVRIFGVYEGFTMLALAVGAFAVPVLVESFGVGRAAGVTGVAVSGVAFVAVATVLQRLDDLPQPDPAVVDRLLADPLFAPLDVLAIEALTSNAKSLVQSAGTTVIRQGDDGDRYYLVVEGELDVAVDGRLCDRLSSGGSFGELALLRDVPRQATVTAVTDVVLLTVDRATFLESVTGHPQSRVTADRVADMLLDGR